MNISVIGLGKLGLCTASCFAAIGHKVIGVDANQRHIQSLENGECPIEENGLAELLEKARPNMAFTTNAAEAVRRSDASLIIVPTPSLPDGAFTNEYVLSALKAMAPALRDKAEFHVVDVVSTVMPGSSEDVFRPLLEAETGKKCGVDFGLVYNPEFIALGSVIRDFLNPDMVLIGASDDRSAQYIRQLYGSLVQTQPQYSIMSLTNAEIAKLSLNCFVTMKISFANELAMVCQGIPGADVDVVSGAIGADSRVGKKYLKGGLGFGGPCFPRDNRALQRAAADRGVSMHLSPSVIRVNEDVVEDIVRTLDGALGSGRRVAVYGLSYKSGTHIVEESQSLTLAEALLDKGCEVCLHDPMALKSLDRSLLDRVDVRHEPYEAAAGADALVFMTDWPQFRELDIRKLAERCKPSAVVYDSWRMLQGLKTGPLRYIGRGLGDTAQSAKDRA